MTQKVDALGPDAGAEVVNALAGVRQECRRRGAGERLDQPPLVIISVSWLGFPWEYDPRSAFLFF